MTQKIKPPTQGLGVNPKTRIFILSKQADQFRDYLFIGDKYKRPKFIK